MKIRRAILCKFLVCSHTMATAHHIKSVGFGFSPSALDTTGQWLNSECHLGRIYQSFLQVPKKHQILFPQLCWGSFHVSLCTNTKGATVGPAALEEPVTKQHKQAETLTMLWETSQASSWHSLLAAERNRLISQCQWSCLQQYLHQSHYNADSLPKLLRKVIYICKIVPGVSQVETSLNNRM